QFAHKLIKRWQFVFLNRAQIARDLALVTCVLNGSFFHRFSCVRNTARAMRHNVGGTPCHPSHRRRASCTGPTTAQGRFAPAGEACRARAKVSFGFAPAPAFPPVSRTNDSNAVAAVSETHGKNAAASAAT